MNEKEKRTSLPYPINSPSLSGPSTGLSNSSTVTSSTLNPQLLSPNLANTSTNAPPQSLVIDKKLEKKMEKVEKDIERIDHMREKKDKERDREVEREIEKISKDRDRHEQIMGKLIDEMQTRTTHEGPSHRLKNQQRQRLHELFGQIEKEFDMLWEENQDCK